MQPRYTDFCSENRGIHELHPRTFFFFVHFMVVPVILPETLVPNYQIWPVPNCVQLTVL